MLMAVAVAGGLLGVANSSKAESSASTLVNRYLVLGPAVRELRASVSAFQVVAEAAFGGSAIDASTLTAAVGDSTATNQAYLSLQRLLAEPANADLTPGLAPLVSTYVSSRTGLATLLAPGARSQQAPQVAAVERAAYKSLDAALGSLQATITARLVHTAGQARSAARHARDDLIACLVIGVAFGVVVTSILARKALRVERDSVLRDAAQAQVTRRNEFEGRLQRALEMAKAEAPVFDLVAQALGDAAPGMRSELLLADSSRAHFRQVLVSSAHSDEPGCGVVSPDDCPAASRGQTMVFPLSTAMDACPHLRGRACSALCVPVSISGNSIGVVHVMATDGSPPVDAVSRDVEVVARRASERLAMLRAFALSQTEANSDSLTGLLTRRSLQSRLRDIQENGASYVVAYGDLDHFKQLNDVFGHDAGDRALRTFSQVLRDALRPSDLPCRYGGEEFVIILPACPIDEAVPVLDRVRQRIADRLTSGRLPNFTVSFGVASSDQAADFEQVVALADEALLRAKANGRDQVVVARDVPAGGPLLGTDGISDAGRPKSEVVPLPGVPAPGREAIAVSATVPG